MMERMSVLLTFICLFLLLGYVESAAFSCGDGFVSVGDLKAKVLLECGEPYSKEKGGTKKGTGKGTAGHRKARLQSEYTETSGKRIEKWYYNCGDNDFIYILTFEGNTLAKEETGGYGRGKSECEGKNR
jgi:hypothetical protein